MNTQIKKIFPFGLALTALALDLSVLEPVRAQTFTPDKPLLVARWSHTATRLTNGLLLVAGGTTANEYPDNPFRATNSAELYDPASGTSTSTGFMTDAQAGHIAMLLTNGLVLVAGGRNDHGSIISRAELYNPATGEWTDTGYLNQERSSFAGVLLPDGKVLVVGGYSNSGDISSAEIYDPLSKTWANAAPMNYAADSQTVTRLLNGQVLVAGGSGGGGGLTNSVLYDPVNITWTNTGSLNIARAGHVATLLPDGQVLVVGGNNDNSAEVYNPDDGKWTLVASMNDGRSNPSATLLPNGQVLVLGGYPGQTSAELYNPTNNTWTYTDPLNVGRIFHTATLVADGQVVVAGGDAGTIGYYNGPAMADVETYNQVAQTSPFSFALNTTNLVWTTGGDANWFAESTNTHDNASAAQSGLIADGQTNWIQTIVPSDGQLSFYWKVSSEDSSDYLTFYINGNSQDAISGEVNWNQESYSVSAGDTLRWEYSKDGSFSDGLDAGFLDEVSYAVDTTPGLIVTASPLTGPVPLTVQFSSPSVDTFGNTVTNWNWNFGDGGSSTAQSPSHNYTNIGSFSPNLTAYSTYGASPLSVSGPGTITVTNHTLNVTASPQAGPLPLTVQFSSPSVDSGGNIVTNWNWNFGDGGASTAQNPSHIYTSASTFSPSVVARSTYSASPLDITGLSAITTTNPPNPNFRTLYSFTPAFGSDPSGPLVISGSTLYGTTSIGGASNSGTLFAINTSGSGFTNLYSFNPVSGSRPNGVVLSGSTLYGPTDFGGSRGGGTVFAISTNGTGYTNLYNLNFNVDPNSPNTPQAPLALAGNNLYGATWFGGTYNHGTVFFVPTNGANSGILHSFTTPSYNTYANNFDGIFPSSRLIYSGGTLYGTAEQGGSYGGGTVFAIITNQPASFSILHYFTAPDSTTGTNSDGAFSFSGLFLSGSTLYGTTFGGGATGNGTVFAVNTDGLGFTNLHSFTGGNGGSGPHAGVTLSGNTLYGTTSSGGTSGNGTLFALNTDGSGFTSLYSFTGGSDGADPETELILSGNTLYGTANSGGGSGNGTVFGFALPSSILLANLIKPPGGSFQFSFLTVPGSTNTVFATTNLALAFSDWTLLGIATEVTAGHFQFTDPQATNNSKRFYRVRSP